MAPKNQKKNVQNIQTLNKRVTDLEDIVQTLQDENQALMKRLLEMESYRGEGLKLNKVEGFNGETVPPVKDGMQMDDQHKLQSMVNALKILPPNFAAENKSGRHSPENVQAMCGFQVTPKMLDQAYEALEQEV